MEMNVNADRAGTVVLVCDFCILVCPCTQIISWIGVFLMCYCSMLKWCCIRLLVGGCVNIGVK